MFHPVTGKQLEEGAAFCPACGQALKRQPTPSQSSQRSTSRKAEWGLGVFCFLLLLLLAWGGWAHWVRPEAEREKAHRLMDVVYQACSPSMAGDAMDDWIRKTEEQIQSLDLEWNEKTMLEAGFENQLTARGCTFQAVHSSEVQSKARKRR